MILGPYQFGINRRLVLLQVILDWYVFPYQYTYQYHIPKLFIISQGAYAYFLFNKASNLTFINVCQTFFFLENRYKVLPTLK